MTLSVKSVKLAEIRALTGGQTAPLAVQSQGVVMRLHGSLHADADLSLLDALKNKKNILDFSHLAGVSWDGASKLRSYLASYDLPLQLVGVPPIVHRYLQCMPLRNHRILVATLDVEVFDPLQPGAATGRVALRVQELERLARTQGQIMSVALHQQIVGIAQHLCPRHGHTLDLHALRFTNAWCRREAEEALFWFSLCPLFNALTAVGMGRLRAAEAVIARQWLAARGPATDSLTVSTRLQKNTREDAFATASAALAGVLDGQEQLTHKLEFCLRSMQLAGVGNKGHGNPEALYEVAQSFLQAPVASSEGDGLGELVGLLQRVERLLLGRGDADASAAGRSVAAAVVGAAELLDLRGDLQALAALLPDLRAKKRSWQNLQNSLMARWHKRRLLQSPDLPLLQFYLPAFASEMDVDL